MFRIVGNWNYRCKSVMIPLELYGYLWRLFLWLVTEALKDCPDVARKWVCAHSHTHTQFFLSLCGAGWVEGAAFMLYTQVLSFLIFIFFFNIYFSVPGLSFFVFSSAGWLVPPHVAAFVSAKYRRDSQSCTFSEKIPSCPQSIPQSSV